MNITVGEDKVGVIIEEDKLHSNIAQSFYNLFDHIDETERQKVFPEGGMDAQYGLSQKFVNTDLDQLLADARTQGCAEKLLEQMIAYILSKEINKAR